MSFTRRSYRCCDNRKYTDEQTLVTTITTSRRTWRRVTTRASTIPSLRLLDVLDDEMFRSYRPVMQIYMSTIRPLPTAPFR